MRLFMSQRKGTDTTQCVCVKVRGRGKLSKDPFQNVWSVRHEQVLDFVQLGLGLELGDVLCGPSTKEDVELEPTALFAAVDNATLADRYIAWDGWTTTLWRF